MGRAGRDLAVSIWTPLVDPSVAQRWFTWPGIMLLSPVPILTALIAFAAWRAAGSWGGDATLFLSAMGLLFMSYLGIAIGRWPMIVPGHFTLHQAASSPGTQAFLLIGTLVLIPVILTYTTWSYWVFRGKMRGDIPVVLCPAGGVHDLLDRSVRANVRRAWWTACARRSRC